MEDNERKAKTIPCFIFNAVCSIVIILINKWIYAHVKYAPFLDLLPLALTFYGFVVFTNLSLQNNTVGTYQVAKVMTTPCIVLIQMYFYDKKFSLNVQLTLIPIILGVIINFCYDIYFNYTGTIYASLGVIITSLYQVWVGETQTKLEMDAMQLLYYQAPISAGLLLLAITILEPLPNTWSHKWTPLELGMVMASACIALFINLTIYWIIGNTSPLRYNMVGQLKFCLTLLGAFLLFKDPFHFNQIIGIILMVIGVIFYAYFKLKEDSTRNTENQEEDT